MTFQNRCIHLKTTTDFAPLRDRMSVNTNTVYERSHADALWLIKSS